MPAGEDRFGPGSQEVNPQELEQQPRKFLLPMIDISPDQSLCVDVHILPVLSPIHFPPLGIGPLLDPLTPINVSYTRNRPDFPYQVHLENAAHTMTPVHRMGSCGTSPGPELTNKPPQQQVLQLSMTMTTDGSCYGGTYPPSTLVCTYIPPVDMSALLGSSKKEVLDCPAFLCQLKLASSICKPTYFNPRESCVPSPQPIPSVRRPLLFCNKSTSTMPTNPHSTALTQDVDLTTPTLSKSNKAGQHLFCSLPNTATDDDRAEPGISFWTSAESYRERRRQVIAKKLDVEEESASELSSTADPLIRATVERHPEPPPAGTSHPTFMSLPIEIRELIYSYLPALRMEDREVPMPSRFPVLLLVSWTLCIEYGSWLRNHAEWMVKVDRLGEGLHQLARGAYLNSKLLPRRLDLEFERELPTLSTLGDIALFFECMFRGGRDVTVTARLADGLEPGEDSSTRLSSYLAVAREIGEQEATRKSSDDVDIFDYAHKSDVYRTVSETLRADADRHGEGERLLYDKRGNPDAYTAMWSRESDDRTPSSPSTVKRRRRGGPLWHDIWLIVESYDPQSMRPDYIGSTHSHQALSRQGGHIRGNEPDWALERKLSHKKWMAIFGYT